MIFSSVNFLEVIAKYAYSSSIKKITQNRRNVSIGSILQYARKVRSKKKEMGKRKIQNSDLFAQRIRRAMDASGLGRTEVANQIGVSQQTVSKWATGVARPGFDLLPKLAEVLNVSIAYFFGRPSLQEVDKGDDGLVSYPVEGLMQMAGGSLIYEPRTKKKHTQELPLALARELGLDGDDIKVFIVRGNLTERLRDGALVYVKTDIKPTDIPSGSDVIIKDSDGQWILKHWMCTKRGPVLTDLIDRDSELIIYDGFDMPIYGMVVRVFG